MKMRVTIAAIALSAISFTAWSQDGDKKEKELDKTQESKRERSTQGLRTDNELKDDRGEVQSNEYRNSKADSAQQQGESEGEVIEPNKDQGPQSNDDSNNPTSESDTTQNSVQRNTPAVIQRTSSESGSPAVLSGNNGKERDGTNNVQRATPNMAGAKEPGNMNLSEKNDTPKKDAGTDPKIRKQNEKSTQTRDTKKTDETETMPPPEQDQQSGVLKENTTLEPEPATTMTAKEERKAKRKNRRNRRKD